MSYNGWKNRETWNVALWLGHDESMYRLVQECAKGLTYRDFATNYLAWQSAVTKDGVAWLDENLDYDALNDFIKEEE